ncbi:hypothetical protein FQA39_LY05748 [Lamprigera yunnana]|nr:hypothetical protein FQA39_LY05748 [Lamprigera yunnana]
MLYIEYIMYHTHMESLEEVAAREQAEKQQSLRELEDLYEWLQQFEDPPPAPRPPPPYQFRNDILRLNANECLGVDGKPKSALPRWLCQPGIANSQPWHSVDAALDSHIFPLAGP